MNCQGVSAGLYNAFVVCSLCGTRRARRGCPALGRQICPVCCGTKRLVEIRCPADCSWLVSSRTHPPATVHRQQQRDQALFMEALRDFDERQSRLFVLVSMFLASYKPPELQPVLDVDVVDAASALASTFETAARGVIYEHRPQSAPAERLATALKPVLTEAGSGSAFERDCAMVLRRIADTAGRRPAHHEEAGDASARAFLDWTRRSIDNLQSAIYKDRSALRQ